MDHTKRRELTKQFGLADDTYYLWVYREEREPAWRLAYETKVAAQMTMYCDRYRERYPEERIKTMRGSTYVLFDGLARNFRTVIR